MNFPAHPLFAAAALERKFPLRSLRTMRASAAGVAALAAVGSFITGQALLLGLALAAVGVSTAFLLLVRFVLYYYGTSFSPLPATVELVDKIDFSATWPYYLDFFAVRFLSRAAGGNTREILRHVLASPEGDFFFLRTGIRPDDFFAKLGQAYQTEAPPTLSLATLAREAAELAVTDGRSAITPADCMAVLWARDTAFSQAMLAHDLTAEDFRHLNAWMRIAAGHRPKPFLQRLRESPGIGKEWAYGYTVFLDRFTRPIRVERAEELHILAHEHETGELEEALSKASSANAIIVGEPGVGKMAIVNGLAQRIRQGESTPGLNYGRLLKLEMQLVLAGKAAGAIEQTLAALFRDVEYAGNIILVIEDIDHYFTPGTPTHLTESLLPFLRSPLIRVIGLASPDGYAKSIASYSVLSSLFHEILVAEPSKEVMMDILGDACLHLEGRYGHIMLYPALFRVYELAQRYISGTPFPEKGIMLLQEVFAAARELGRGAPIAPELVERVLERRIGAAVGAVKEKERDILLNLEDELHTRVVNQEGAISALADALRRKRTGVAAGSKPAGSFLFLGPTGVGKTETAKALASVSFGSTGAMIRLDMSEYQGPEDTDRLMGSPRTGEAGYLAEKVRERPFSLLLLDEIEKAHANILNLFLQILDAGEAKDGFSKRVDFKNTFIIGTSNAGSEQIREFMATGTPYSELQKKLVDEILRQRLFRPEFLNRFDAVIVYSPLSHEHVKKVAHLLLRELAARLQSEGYALAWTDEVLQSLAERGYSDVFGARELRRVIQDKIEAGIAKEILAGKYKRGDTITISPLS